MNLVSRATEVRPGHEGGGDFAPALGGGSGANRGTSALGMYSNICQDGLVAGSGHGWNSQDD